MSLADVYLQHRVQLLERQVTLLFETTRVLHPEAAEELARLERAWRAELGQLHAAFLRGDLAHFERREARVRGGG